MKEDFTDGDLIDVRGLDVHQLLAEDRRPDLARALQRVLAADDEAFAGFQASI